ncbi:Ldh family oxidoreductase [Starkeya sp. ORNL1]|uniref:Ldh family oxidoreductase n=1 Tax=Starkeya sp. ORNL1 TaxID=2709380 RepID=UPI001462EB4C|nr:Ldh family oxidoreductase [Starkeya sp. ORNL1]QJP15650.1 Ldh family oxidoreductase [Starkeya sp. ORNL1]
MNVNAAGTVHVAAPALEDWVAAVFARARVPEVDARQTAAVLVRTNLRGIDTHGVMRVMPYLEKLRSGEVNAAAHPRAEVREGVLHVDGDRGLGQVVASFAVERAVELARSQPVVMGIIRNSGHLAALGLFVLPAAEQGMIAVLCQETPPLMALEGASGAAIGNNPIAFAAPVAEGQPLVFDMATSIVARGNVLQAARDKTPIPEGWSIGPDGLPTTDPMVALKGAMLPMAGHKGIGLAMMVQILAGSLSASRTAESAATFGATSAAGNVSAFLLVINPDRVVGRAAFDAHVAQWLTTYATASGEEARYPGERASLCEVERRRDGIPLSLGAVAELRKVGELVGLEFNLAPAACP